MNKDGDGGDDQHDNDDNNDEYNGGDDNNEVFCIFVYTLTDVSTHTIQLYKSYPEHRCHGETFRPVENSI